MTRFQSGIATNNSIFLTLRVSLSQKFSGWAARKNLISSLTHRTDLWTTDMPQSYR